MNDNSDEKISNEINLKLKEIDDDIKNINKYIFSIESEYLNTTSMSGNIIKGWEQLFSAKPKLSNSTNYLNNKRVKVSNNERLFSQTDIEFFNKFESKFYIMRFSWMLPKTL